MQQLQADDRADEALGRPEHHRETDRIVALDAQVEGGAPFGRELETKQRIAKVDVLRLAVAVVAGDGLAKAAIRSALIQHHLVQRGGLQVQPPDRDVGGGPVELQAQPDAPLR